MNEELPLTFGEQVYLARKRKGWRQSDLGAAIGMDQQSVQKIESGKTKRTPKARAIIEALGMPEEALSLLDLSDGDSAPPHPRQFGHERMIERPRAAAGIPVYTSSDAGNGEIVVSADPIDYRSVPPALQRASGVYMLYVSGATMDPEIEPGEPVVINPNLPATPARAHVFYHKNRESRRAVVARLERMDAKNWFIRQHNPAKHNSRDAMMLDRSEWPEACRILKSGDLV